jgi:hypothetical protein
MQCLSAADFERDDDLQNQAVTRLRKAAKSSFFEIPSA